MPVCGLNQTHGLVPYKGDKGDKSAANPPEGSLVETRCLIKGPKSAIVPFPGPRSGPKSRTGPGAVFVAASHQTRLDTRSKARRPIKVGIKGRGGRERAETRTLLVCAAHRLTQCNVSLMRQAVSRTQMWVQARMPVNGLNQTHGLVPYKGDKGDKSAANPPEGSLVETRCLIKGPKSAIVPFPGPRSGPTSRTGPGALAAKSVPNANMKREVKYDERHPEN